jgi:Protein of unknown function (DUF3060)
MKSAGVGLARLANGRIEQHGINGGEIRGWPANYRCGTIWQMKDDDPEKRIRELERELADSTRPPQSTPPYTGNAPYTANPPYAGNAPYVRDPTWGIDFRPPRRKSPYPWFVVLIVLGIFVPTIVSLVAHFATSNRVRSAFGNGSGATASTNNPTAVPQGGELRVGGNMEGKTVACNDGKLTLYGYNSKYVITGHCAGLTVGGYNNDVTFGSADTLESTGYGNIVTVQACNNGNLTMSSYGITFNVTGHCASLTISSYNNKVTVDSVDRINIKGAGYNNVVTYHSGAPKITDSGYSNTIQQG